MIPVFYLASKIYLNLGNYRTLSYCEKPPPTNSLSTIHIDLIEFFIIFIILN